MMIDVLGRANIPLNYCYYIMLNLYLQLKGIVRYAICIFTIVMKISA